MSNKERALVVVVVVVDFLVCQVALLMFVASHRLDGAAYTAHMRVGPPRLYQMA